MRVCEVRVERVPGGGWHFDVVDGPVEAVAIVVTEESAGSLVWQVTSDAFGEETYQGSVEFVGEPKTVNVAEVTEEELVADLVSRGVDPEIAADRSATRPASTFEYGRAPLGFRARHDCPTVAPAQGHTCAVWVVGFWAFPVALGTFNG